MHKSCRQQETDRTRVCDIHRLMLRSPPISKCAQLTDCRVRRYDVAAGNKQLSTFPTAVAGHLKIYTGGTWTAGGKQCKKQCSKWGDPMENDAAGTLLRAHAWRPCRHVGIQTNITCCSSPGSSGSCANEPGSIQPSSSYWRAICSPRSMWAGSSSWTLQRSGAQNARRWAVKYPLQHHGHLLQEKTLVHGMVNVNLVAHLQEQRGAPLHLLRYTHSGK